MTSVQTKAKLLTEEESTVLMIGIQFINQIKKETNKTAEYWVHGPERLKVKLQQAAVASMWSA